MELEKKGLSKITNKKRKRSSRFVPYASGFKRPSTTSQINAIGFSPDAIESVFSPSLEFFHPVPRPTSIDDWLAQYTEDGQTYRQFLRECPWLSKRKVKYICQEFNPEGKNITEKYPEGKIYIVPLGDFDNQQVQLDNFTDYVIRFLCLPVSSLPEIKLICDKQKIFLDESRVQSSSTQATRRRTPRVTKTELITRHNTKSGHFQIRVDSILQKLRQMIPKDALCLIALTSVDLYGASSDLFVAGMAAGNQRVAIFSLYRYDPSLNFSTEFWYEVSKSDVVTETEKKRLLFQRGCKLLVHEISHLLGIAHCVYFDCCMNGSGHLSEDFRQPMHLCPVDLRKLQTLCGFDVHLRYEDLLQFYKRHQLKDEAGWIEKRLQFIRTISSVT